MTKKPEPLTNHSMNVETAKNAILKSWVEFRWYAAGHAFYFAALGIQGVVYPFLVTFVLLKPADMVGIAQMFTMLPMFGLVLLGGMTADRRELRMHLIRLQLLAAVPMFCMAVLVISNTLTFLLLIVCGMGTGCVSAFVMPARDSLLNRVAQRSPNGDIQQAVTRVTGIQFAAQLAGIFLGRQVSDTGAGIMLLALAFCYLSAAFCTTNLRPAPPWLPEEPGDDVKSEPRWQRSLREIREGLLEVRQSSKMFPVVLFIFLSGVLFNGVFSVHLQVLIRDEYQGDISDYSIILITFMVGITLSTTYISRYTRIMRQGRAMLISFAMTAIVFIAIHFYPPLWLLYTLVFFWGASAAIIFSISRAIVQESASESHRARVMSVFQLGFLGGAPLGALVMGYATRLLGPLDAILLPASGVILISVVMLTLTDLWNIRRPEGQRV